MNGNLFVLRFLSVDFICLVLFKVFFSRLESSARYARSSRHTRSFPCTKACNNGLFLCGSTAFAHARPSRRSLWNAGKRFLRKFPYSDVWTISMESRISVTSCWRCWTAQVIESCLRFGKANTELLYFFVAFVYIRSPSH